MIEAAMATDLHLALDVHTQGVRELEGMEEGVGDHGGPLVGRTGLQEAGDHLGSQHATELIRQVDHMTRSIGGHAGLYAHVELTWRKSN